MHVCRDQLRKAGITLRVMSRVDPNRRKTLSQTTLVGMTQHMVHHAERDDYFHDYRNALISTLELRPLLSYSARLAGGMMRESETA